MDLSQLLSNIRKFGLEVYGHFYSKYPGYVVDNDDPKNQGRVKVITPTIHGYPAEAQWAYQSGIYKGVNITPEIGDLVWVEFLNGRSNSPVWSHHFPLKDQKPKEFKSPKSYGFKSPAGYLVLIDEPDKTIKILSPEGPEIKVLNKAITITSGDNVITIDDKGIDVKAEKGDIFISNDNSHLSITDVGINIGSENGIFINGQNPILYSNVPGATEIIDVSEIGVSTKVKVG